MYRAVLNVKPVSRGAIASITAHNARSEEYAAKTTHIDPGRVCYNMVLMGTSDPTQDLLGAIDGISMARKGKDPKKEYVGAELILSAHADYFRSQSFDQLKDWVDRNMAWLRQEYDQAGRGKVVSVIMHMDEKAPHLHAVIAPIVTKSRIHPVTKELMAPKPQLNYCALFGDRQETLAKARKEHRQATDTTLGRLQTSYAQAMAPCGLERGISGGRKAHIPPKIYRRFQNEIDLLQEQLKNVQALQAQLVTECNRLQAQRENEAKNVEELENYRQITMRNAKEWEAYREGIKQDCEALGEKREIEVTELEILEMQYVTEKMALDALQAKKEKEEKELENLELTQSQCESDIETLIKRHEIMQEVLNKIKEEEQKIEDEQEKFDEEQDAHHTDMSVEMEM